MIRVSLGPDALGRVRLAYSPMWELITSLRVLLHGRCHQQHASWVAWASSQVDAELLDLLAGLMPTPDLCPDFLTPTPSAQHSSFRAELAAMAATDPGVARAEIEICWDDRPPETVRTLLRDPSRAMARITGALERYWRLVFVPVWPRLRGLLAADLAYRADQFALDGLRPLLNRLHPSVSFDGGDLLIDKRAYDIKRDAGPEGIVLLSCAFASRDVRLVICDPYPVMLSYGLRGSTRLWSPRSIQTDRAARLIGRNRATILASLDLPMNTTQLADEVALSTPAVSQHLSVLRRSGLVLSRRAGRTTWNTLTPLGRAVLEAKELDRSTARPVIPA